MKRLEDYMNKFKPDAAYFLPIGGHRTQLSYYILENYSQASHRDK
jgi:hypothetical protein